MSEYQYYEFRALDRPLDKDAQASLRKISSRATITATQFVNVYNYGDFRGNPTALMETYFDIFVYIANWGTHQLMLRLPRHLLDPAVAMQYGLDEGAVVREAGDCVILEYQSEREGDGGWVDEDEGPAWMAALLPVRAALATGDLRPLYLGWLASLASYEVDEEIDDDEQREDEDESLDGEGAAPESVEPPVPPGLRTLPEELRALADFLGVDTDLIAVAAESSVDLEVHGPSRRALGQWIGELDVAEKDALLLRLAADGDTTLRAELLQRYRRASAPDQAPAVERRTIGRLLAAARQRTAERKRREAEQEAQERARAQREAAAARATHLNRFTGQEPALWQQVEDLIATKHPANYDQAVTLLTDLRDLAARTGEGAVFAARLTEVRLRHARKTTLLQRLDRSTLGGS